MEVKQTELDHVKKNLDELEVKIRQTNTITLLEQSKSKNLIRVNDSKDLFWNPARHNEKTKALVEERNIEIQSQIN